MLNCTCFGRGTGLPQVRHAAIPKNTAQGRGKTGRGSGVAALLAVTEKGSGARSSTASPVPVEVAAGPRQGPLSDGRGTEAQSSRTTCSCRPISRRRPSVAAVMWPVSHVGSARVTLLAVVQDPLAALPMAPCLTAPGVEGRIEEARARLERQLGPFESEVDVSMGVATGTRGLLRARLDAEAFRAPDGPAEPRGARRLALAQHAWGSCARLSPRTWRSRARWSTPDPN